MPFFSIFFAGKMWHIWPGNTPKTSRFLWFADWKFTGLRMRIQPKSCEFLVLLFDFAASVAEPEAAQPLIIVHT
jgi:hypothetical protein